MVIDNKILDNLTARAKASPRLRMNLNFHQSLDEKCHRFLNAVEPVSVNSVATRQCSSELGIMLVAPSFLLRGIGVKKSEDLEHLAVMNCEILEYLAVINYEDLEIMRIFAAINY